MNAWELVFGGIIGAIVWSLISYAAISFIQTIEDNARDKARSRARRAFRPGRGEKRS